jgi:hypothetical protein
MPIPGPGTAISMTTIATEFGGTVPHSLSEYYRGGSLVPNVPSNNSIPTSGTIAMGDFYGTGGPSRVAVNLTIAGNTSNYDVYDNRGPTYSAGSTDLTVTVNPGVVVSGGSPGLYAMLVPSAFGAGDTVTIVNNGTLIGSGGNGGPGNTSSPGTPGTVGGNALFVNRPTTITNNNLVAGGGGGGGGGCGAPAPLGRSRGAGGGGGGAGSAVGGGGSGSAASVNGQPGQPGTFTTGGAGGAASSAPATPGGPGGGQGAAGTGANPSPRGSGGAGGGAGNYVVGNPFVTWPATGTRLGGVA